LWEDRSRHAKRRSSTKEIIMAVKKRGTWGIRFLIHFFTVALAVLFYWLEGFLLEDIQSIPGPPFEEMRGKYVEAALDADAARLSVRIAAVDREMAGKREEQQLLGDSTHNLQSTIDQLVALQRQSIEKKVPLSDAEKENLSNSLKQFFENQKTYQDLNKNIAALSGQKRQMEEEKRKLDGQIEKQTAVAQAEHEKIVEAHRMKLAFYQLLILVPLLLVAGYFLLSRRKSLYYPLFLAFGGATIIQVALVIHEYFPTRYTKYVLTAVLLGVVAKLLIHFIKTVAAPKIDLLLRQYREAYERFLCPICEYPIRTGPRKFLYWTRRTVNKILPQCGASDKNEPYHCPSCGTALFENCLACKDVRHSLLEHCEHCGAKIEIQ
jgi:hypothetical protein